MHNRTVSHQGDTRIHALTATGSDILSSVLRTSLRGGPLDVSPYVRAFNRPKSTWALAEFKLMSELCCAGLGNFTCFYTFDHI